LCFETASVAGRGEGDTGDWLIGVVSDGFGIELAGVAGVVVVVVVVVFGFFEKKEKRFPCFKLPVFLLLKDMVNSQCLFAMMMEEIMTTSQPQSLLSVFCFLD